MVGFQFFLPARSDTRMYIAKSVGIIQNGKATIFSGVKYGSNTKNWYVLSVRKKRVESSDLRLACVTPVTSSSSCTPSLEGHSEKLLSSSRRSEKSICEESSGLIVSNSRSHKLTSVGLRHRGHADAETHVVLITVTDP